MTNFIAGLLGIGALLSYLYGLYRNYKTAMDKVAQAEAAAKVKTDLDKVAEDAKISDEKVIDFNDAAVKFESNNKPGKS